MEIVFKMKVLWDMGIPFIITYVARRHESASVIWSLGDLDSMTSCPNLGAIITHIVDDNDKTKNIFH